MTALLKQKVDVNAAQGDGATALHWAAHWDDLQTAELLIRAGASVNAANDLGVTPFSLACLNGSALMVGKLLAAGANANTVSSGEPVLMTAARSGSAEVVKALLARGADVNAKDATRGQTALMWAVAQRHPAVVRTLIEVGADVHARSLVSRQVVQRGSRYGGVISRERAASERAVTELVEGGSTPLLFAARSGDLESAQLLVDAGADANDLAPDGTSALVVASHSGHGQPGGIPLEQGRRSERVGAGYTALHAAVLTGDLELVKTLVAHRADPNATVTKGTPSRRYSKDLAFNEAWVGATAFWLAARFAEVEIMRALADGGANPLTAARDETTPLIAIVAAGVDAGPSASDSRERRLDPAELLARAADRDQIERQVLQAVELAVNLGADVNAVNYVGDTALHHAASKGFNTVIQYLAGKGARLDLKNKRAQTPLGIASRSRPRPTARALHRSRARRNCCASSAPRNESACIDRGRVYDAAHAHSHHSLRFACGPGGNFSRHGRLDPDRHNDSNRAEKEAALPHLSWRRLSPEPRSGGSGRHRAGQGRRVRRDGRSPPARSRSRAPTRSTCRSSRPNTSPSSTALMMMTNGNPPFTEAQKRAHGRLRARRQGAHRRALRDRHLLRLPAVRRNARRLLSARRCGRARSPC